PAEVSPFIVEPPESMLVWRGTNVTLSVRATGTPSLAYQWKHNGVPLEGVIYSVLYISDVEPAQAGEYTVEVASPYGSTSASANVILRPNTGPVILQQP